jgi:hypothetical protein
MRCEAGQIRSREDCRTVHTGSLPLPSTPLSSSVESEETGPLLKRVAVDEIANDVTR